MSLLAIYILHLIKALHVDLFPQLCVGNDMNAAVFGQLGGIPYIVSFLASGIDDPLTINAVTAAMHLLRVDFQNKIAFCNCGGEHLQLIRRVSRQYIPKIHALWRANECAPLHNAILVDIPLKI